MKNPQQGYEAARIGAGSDAGSDGGGAVREGRLELAHQLGLGLGG